MATKIVDILEKIKFQKVGAGATPYFEIGDINIQTKDISLKNKPSVAGAVLCPADSIIVSKVRPSRGAIALINSEVSVSSAFTILKPQKGRCHPKYLFYYLAWNKNFFSFLQSRATGATYPTVKEENILNYPIYLPDLAEQEQSVAIFEKAEALKKKRAGADKKMNALTSALFLKMFGDPLTNSMEWEIKRLGKLCTIRRGASPRPIKKYTGGTVPWIKIGDGTKGNEIYITDTVDRIISEGVSKSVFLKKGSMIFANCGVSLGFARILKIDGCIHDGWLSFENINSGELNEIYLLKLINIVTPHLRRIASSGTQPNLNTSIMNNFQIILPPLDMQVKFSKVVEEIEIQKEKQKLSAQKIDEVFQSLLSRYFTV